MERNMNQSLLSARISEIKGPLRETRDRLNHSLPSTSDAIVLDLATLATCQKQLNDIADMRKEKVLLQQGLQVDADNVLQPLIDLYHHESRLKADLNKAIATVRQRLQQANYWTNQHAAAFERLHNDTLAELAASVDAMKSPTLASLQDVTEFMHSVSQQASLKHAEELQGSLRQRYMQQLQQCQRTVALLTKYHHVATGYPDNMLQTNRFHVWSTLYKEVLASPDTITLQAVHKQATTSMPQTHASRSLLATAQSLERLYQDARNRENAFKKNQKASSSAALLKARLDEQQHAVTSFAQSKSASGTQEQYTCATECALVNVLCEQIPKLKKLDRKMQSDTSTDLHHFRKLSDCLREVHLVHELLNDVYASQDLSMPMAISADDLAEPLDRALQAFMPIVTFTTSATGLIVRMFKLLQESQDACAVAEEVTSSKTRDSAARLLADHSLSTEALTPAQVEEIKRLDHDVVSLLEGMDEGDTLGGLINTNLQAMIGVIDEYVRMPFRPRTTKTALSWAGIDATHPTLNNHDTLPRSMARLSAFVALAQCLKLGLEHVASLSSTTPPTQESSTSLHRAFEQIESTLFDHMSRVYKAFLRGILPDAVQAYVGGRILSLGLDANKRGADHWASGGALPELENLVTEAVAGCIARGKLRADQLTQAKRVVNGYMESNRKYNQAEVMEQATMEATAHAEWCHQQLVLFQWLHSPALAGSITPTAPRLRHIVADLLQAAKELQSIHKSYQITQQDLDSSYDTIIKRLRWAAGTRKPLMETAEAFEDSVKQDRQFAQRSSQAASVLAGMANALAHFESFRTLNSETNKLEKDSLSLIENLSNAVRRVDLIREEAAKIEQGLPDGLRDFAPEGQVTRPWMLKRQQELPKVLLQQEMGINATKPRLQEAQANLVEAASTVQEAQLDLNVIMDEIVPMLQPLIKAGDQGARTFEADFRVWYDKVETYGQALVLLSQLPFEDAVNIEGDATATVDLLTDLQGDSPAQELARGLLDGSIKADLKPIAAYIPEFYNQVLSLQSAAEAVEAAENDGAKPLSPQAQAQSPPEAARSQRNTYAVSIWNRVRAKLHGAVAKSGKLLSVPEHVGLTIKEATSQDNLSVMFEGWTAWV
eukprot:TRINITY_DN10814_c0_g1_i1.p1 TRINITY_DN10814_c0_g1~~TRINITY_DN10814_c0_g1_i1.p1  ORF type:complete len:1230 (+),score=332.84 TRINITY_DN10814_c0_g1_i1:342-3692(+)